MNRRTALGARRTVLSHIPHLMPLYALRIGTCKCTLPMPVVSSRNRLTEHDLYQGTSIMEKDSVKNLCLFHILDGLTDGLTHFSGSSRAALIYAERPEDPIRVYDPQDLLHGHEPRLKELVPGLR